MVKDSSCPRCNIATSRLPFGLGDWCKPCGFARRYFFGLGAGLELRKCPRCPAFARLEGTHEGLDVWSCPNCSFMWKEPVIPGVLEGYWRNQIAWYGKEASPPAPATARSAAFGLGDTLIQCDCGSQLQGQGRIWLCAHCGRRDVLCRGCSRLLSDWELDAWLSPCCSACWPAYR